MYYTIETQRMVREQAKNNDPVARVAVDGIFGIMQVYGVRKDAPKAGFLAEQIHRDIVRQIETYRQLHEK